MTLKKQFQQALREAEGDTRGIIQPPGDPLDRLLRPIWIAIYALSILSLGAFFLAILAVIH